VVFEPEVMADVAMEMLNQTGCCEIRLNTTFLESESKNGMVQKVRLSDGSEVESRFWVDATGDGVAMGLRAGLEGMDMEFIQFHPTGLEGSNYLISEAARGEGGKLINSDGKEFVDELNTRDFVTRAIVKQLQRGKKVYLDFEKN